MQGVINCIKGFLAAILVLSCCVGCATTQPTERQVQTAPPSSAQAAGPPSQKPAQPVQPKAARIQSIQVAGEGGDVVVTVVATGPLKNYQFQRAGENQFVLDLNDVAKDSPRPPLPAASEQIRLAYRDVAAAKGLQVLGTLKNPLDRYFLSPVDNRLVLRLSAAGPVSPAGQQPKAAARTASAAAGQQQSKPPAALAPAPSAPSGAPAKGELAPTLARVYSGKPISLDLLDADVKNVLRLIADITGTNMVIEPDVSGLVTLKVEQVPWDQVLDLMLSMNSLGKEQVGNVIRIATRAKLQQEWEEQRKVLEARQQLLEVAKDFGDITTEYLPVNYAKPADIVARIKEIKSEKGKVSVDERTSLVIYTDYQSRIQNARTLISRLDKPTPQVMIEARIVQLNRSASRELGISWTFFLQHTSGDGSYFSQDFEVNHPVSGDLFGFSFGQLTGQTIWNVDLVLSALESAGEGRIVSAPRVLTLDNVKALIKQGTQIPYLVLSDENVSSTQLIDAVLELQVTPHITPDERVRLEIRAKKDQPDYANAVGIQEQIPIDTREVQTELLVDNGAVVVIGGIIENSEEKSDEGTPGLMNIPILGRLFKTTSVKIDRTELLIFISPKIVGSSSSPVES